jgi:SAM-dependent methyltransferase
MVAEQTKAALRRTADEAFVRRYFVGAGIDIGAGDDGLHKSHRLLPHMLSIRDWDKKDGDAQELSGVADGSFDFAHSSHCLEHMNDPKAALSRWIQVVRPGGHVIVTVPDWEMYERLQWPSIFNREHQWAFTSDEFECGPQFLISVPRLIAQVAEAAVLERLAVIRDHFNPRLPSNVDQTLGQAECAIEFVLRRRDDGSGVV